MGNPHLLTAAANHINDIPADTPMACQTFGGGRTPGSNDTTGSLANAQRWVNGRFVKEPQPPARADLPVHGRGQKARLESRKGNPS
jgi:hypothetical protein